MANPGPAANPVADLWGRLDGERLAWAFRAYSRFVASLSPEIRERLAHKDHQAEPYVVVFGKTQVGKTTLLLELMGVLATQIARVSRVLRGGQPKGQSATATTMEYRRSTDRRWGLRINESQIVWYDDDPSMEAALAHLRQQMEARALAAHAPCVVFLPVDCFAPQATQPAVRMLDLPGDKPSNPIEQEHVSAMARKYVPLADLILLVGRGDDLSFLQEGALTLPGIEDWQSAPRRFRIITTYSFTAQSVREMVRQHVTPANAEVYRQRLIDQIEKSIPLSAEARQPRNFFPLEFGQSWLDAQKQEPVVYERVTPLIDGLKQQLLAEIRSSTTPLARLRAAVDAHIVIAKVKEKRLSAMQTRSSALSAELKKFQQELTQGRAALAQATKAYERLHTQLTILTPARLQKDVQDYLRLSADIAVGDPNESVAGFKVCIQSAKSALTQCVSVARPSGSGLGDTGPFWRSLQVTAESTEISAILRQAFSSLISTLDDYWMDAYFSTGADSKYRRDIASMKAAVEDARLQLTSLAQRCWLEAAQAQVKELRSQLHGEQAKQSSWQQFIDDTIPSIRTLERTLSAHEREQAEFERRMDADMQESQRFVDMLEAEYLAELQDRRARIYREMEPVKSLIELFAATQLEQVRQQVLLHMDHVAD